MNRSLLLKMLAIAGLTVVLLVPLMLINGVISERTYYRNEAVTRIAESSAGEQTLSGAVVVVPYVDIVETVVEGKNDAPAKVRRERSEHQWIFFPDSYAVDGRVNPATRKLGLHEVRVYELEATLQAAFTLAIPATPASVTERQVGVPRLSFGISDVRGLVGTPRLRVDGAETVLEQGSGMADGRGVHADLSAVGAGVTRKVAVTADLVVAGTERLSLAPIGTSNRISLASPWPHPLFAGRFLPRSREVRSNGFDAAWEVSALAAATQRQFLEGASLESLDGLSLTLVEPVNVYSQADRASKYGVLFVLLTFTAFFLFELIKQLRIHPVQYLLVGLALAIFFLLLLSLSEHIAFVWAYLVAAGACIGLLGFYLSFVLRSKARGIGFAAGLTLLYGALYGLLVSEDNALVMGSLLLFAVLASVMVVTRRIDWYQGMPVRGVEGVGRDG
ncbi:cell envelope integrity protein CreD [Chiayiivirga flava]|uniref:Inner membrane protein n=1 Tax=Chiayiivirga flava TaxID=659595 RepID=A0A7W8D559_9GAMM|nr:cell envelope integrity protein CreD [Chiayiivirga flava]MBB5208114.1 inner membrane protein [Chiayiivirga flava]